MPTNLEYIAYEIVNYLPYTFLSVYPLRHYLRFSKKTTALFCLLACGIQVLCFLGSMRLPGSYAEICSVFSTLINIIFYLIAFKASLGRMLYNLFTITNIANFIVIVSKCLEGFFFPEYVMGIYHWTYTLCILLVEPIVILPFFFFIHYFSETKIQEFTITKVWRYAWMIPATFFILWYYIIYHASEHSSLEVALMPKSSILSLFVLLAQFLVHAFLAHFIYNYAKNIELEEDKYYHSLQDIQYKSIQEQIRETRIMRHDMRHHINAIRAYAMNEEYDKLKQYVEDYSNQILSSPQLLFTSNTELNMLLVFCNDMCRQKNIQFEVSAMLPEELPFTSSEITVLFGNLLENAFEACEEQSPDVEKKIIFSGREQQGKIIIILDNTYSNEIKKDSSDDFISTKRNGQGIGTKSVKSIVQNHDGVIQMGGDGEYFHVSIAVPTIEYAM